MSDTSHPKSSFGKKLSVSIIVALILGFITVVSGLEPVKNQILAFLGVPTFSYEYQDPELDKKTGRYAFPFSIQQISGAQIDDVVVNFRTDNLIVSVQVSELQASFNDKALNFDDRREVSLIKPLRSIELEVAKFATGDRLSGIIHTDTNAPIKIQIYTKKSEGYNLHSFDNNNPGALRKIRKILDESRLIIYDYSIFLLIAAAAIFLILIIIKIVPVFIKLITPLLLLIFYPMVVWVEYYSKYILDEKMDSIENLEGIELSVRNSADRFNNFISSLRDSLTPKKRNNIYTYLKKLKRKEDRPDLIIILIIIYFALNLIGVDISAIFTIFIYFLITRYSLIFDYLDNLFNRNQS